MIAVSMLVVLELYNTTYIVQIYNFASYKSL